MKTSFLTKCFPYLDKSLLEEIEEYASLRKFSAQDYVVKQGQIIRFLPIVVSGRIKVFSHEDLIQFLLYYISSGEACIFSFAHTFHNQPAAFSAIAESNSELLLLPADRVDTWVKKYASFSNLVLSAYQKHYNELLDTTKQITCYNLEERLLKYLSNKVQIEKSDLLKISHQEIASDLGTSREVISRLMKKPGLSQKVVQVGRKIKVL